MNVIPLRNLTRAFGSTTAHEALEILQHVGLASADEDGFAFRYTGDMFQRWYKEEGKHDLNNDSRHDPDI